MRQAMRFFGIEIGLALFISLCINVCLISVTAQSFHATDASDGIGLGTVGNALGTMWGSAVNIIFSIGLLASALASSITSTFAGQIVASGYLGWEVRCCLPLLLLTAAPYDCLLRLVSLACGLPLLPPCPHLGSARHSWSLPPSAQVNVWWRAAAVRLATLGPTMVVCTLLEKTNGSFESLTVWLNISQSLVLPFVVLPVSLWAATRPVWAAVR